MLIRFFKRINKKHSRPKCISVITVIALALLASFAPITTADDAVISKLAVHSLLLDGSQQEGLMIVVGERGHILYSNDDGHNWTQASVPTRVLLTGVYMHNSQLAWAVGHDATILRSRDGGKTWQQVYSDAALETPLLDVWFRDANYGFAIGGYGLFLVTEDGGDSWDQHRIDEEGDYHLNHLSKANDGTLFISAEAGNIYRSTDEGETWTPLSSPYHGSLFGTLPIEQDTLLLYGLRGHLFITHDNGATWEDIETHTTTMLTGALKAQSQTCFISALGGVLLIDKDCDGLALEKHQQADRSGIVSLLEAKNGDILLIGEAGITRMTP